MNEPACDVLLLGCEHLVDWDGADGRPDVLSPDRQAELDALVEQLMCFRPSKVAVEAMPEHQDDLDRLRSASDDALATQRGEVIQIGVRLAEKAGASLHAIDADWTLDWSGVTDFLKRHPEREPSSPIDTRSEHVLEDLSTRRHGMTVTELLRELNNDDLAALNDRAYLDIWLTIGSGDNWSGVDLVASWYRRNLRIPANLRGIATGGDRVVVIFGVGHIWSLRHFIDTSAVFQRVPLASVLS